MTATALADLLLAVQSEFNYTSRRYRKRTAKAWSNKVEHLERRVKTLESELERHTVAKTKGGALSKEWILRVFLAAPHVSCRALADSFHLVVGFDSTTVSRGSILSIKAAWAAMYDRMVRSMVRDTVVANLGSCQRAKQPFLAVSFVHVQDEADIRLRSGDARDGPRLPRRARTSKVQLHVVSIAVGHLRWEIPTELEALGDKTTGTLATSLEGVLRGVLGDVLPQNEAGPEIWVFHLLVGDAIPTNDSASRVLYASVKRNPLGPRVRYFAAVVKCMVHQAGLASKGGVIGPAASAAGECHDVTGTATRLFKYLLNDYFDDFATNSRNWVRKNLQVVGRIAANVPSWVESQDYYEDFGRLRRRSIAAPC